MNNSTQTDTLLKEQQGMFALSNQELRNPIIPGYNPDPSICRVGSDYYIVNSTFEFFPGVPIYHSKNLVNWELINYCLTRREQLELEGCRNSGGIYAPTLRFHDGTFFMITTNVTDKGNFIVYTDDIRGNWSNPIWIDQSGIDPSLFWDDDGICYYCSTGNINGIRGIVAFEINPMNGEILSEKKIISTGCGGQCAEGPHIYKKDGLYYLMIAEGGTEYAHRETIQRSSSIWGPYTECPHNPIISHKEYKKSEIQATGHADLTEDEHGNWWMVFLGIRRFSHALLHNLGRETFLAPVKWDENGWPVVGNNGTIELTMNVELPAPANPVNHSLCIDFHDKSLSKHLFYTRNPQPENYVYHAMDGTLTLYGTNITINEPGASPTIMSLKQPQFCTSLTTRIDLDTTVASRCGIAAYYNNDYHYDAYISNDHSDKYICFYKHIHDMGVELCRLPIDKSFLNSGCSVEFKIDTNRENYVFSYRILDASAKVLLDYNTIGSGLNAGLSTEGTRTMTFTGTLFSLFCENGTGVFLDKILLTINPDENYTL